MTRNRDLEPETPRPALRSWLRAQHPADIMRIALMIVALVGIAFAVARHS